MSADTPKDDDAPDIPEAAEPPAVLETPTPDDAIEATPTPTPDDFHSLGDEAEAMEPDTGPPEEPPLAEHDLPEEASPPPEDLAPEPIAEPPLVIPPKAAPPPRRPRAAKPIRPMPRGSFLGRLFRRLLLFAVVFCVVLPVVSTLVYRVVGPPITILMIQRLFEGQGLDRHWVPLSKMSLALPNAVIAAEDARFCSHHGFDFEAMEKAMASNQRRPGKVRGGSTISQQTAKNVFLWPARSYVRKGFEAYFTVLIETLWGKSRIMEVYLNTIEWGPGVYGADAAARRYFGVGAGQLSPAQAARLAAILPSPLKWQAATPGPYVRKRSRRIGAASGTVSRDGLAACVR